MDQVQIIIPLIPFPELQLFVDPDTNKIHMNMEPFQRVAAASEIRQEDSTDDSIFQILLEIE